ERQAAVAFAHRAGGLAAPTGHGAGPRRGPARVARVPVRRRPGLERRRADRDGAGVAGGGRRAAPVDHGVGESPRRRPTRRPARPGATMNRPWALATALALAASGCFSHRLDTNAPGHVSLEPPADLS